MDGKVIAVSCSIAHNFSKKNQECIRLIAGLGVADDAHMGTTVKHRSRVAQCPTQPNLRQVHLIHAELFDELQRSGFRMAVAKILLANQICYTVLGGENVLESSCTLGHASRN